MPEKDDVRKLIRDQVINVLFILIPLVIGWVIKLEVNNATQDLLISDLRSDLAAEQAKNSDVTALQVQIATLSAKHDGTSSKVDKLYDRLIGD